MMQSLSGSSILRCEDILIFLMPVADDSCAVSCSPFSRNYSCHNALQPFML